MKKKNGFTLIELLAVVVILAVIALIATPLILGIINDARKGAFKNTAYGILEAGKFTYTSAIVKTGEIDSTAFTYVDGVETSNPSGRKLEYKGEKPQSGTVVLNSEGKMAIAIYNGSYCAEKDYDDVEVTISQKTEAECQVIFNADLSGASVPVLSTNMIPIKWDGAKWIKADVNNVLGTKQWYDYNAYQWANVALVSEASRAGYVSAAAGVEVNEANVMAYLVWVPRYKYKLFNVAATVMAAQKIDVVFENKTRTKSNGSANGEYLTHPAFTFGTTELDGIWVGKFETTGDATTPTIKPNVASLTNQTIKIQFDTAQKFNIASTYGLSTSNDAHIMKNMEWGAVAYLYQSDYGKYTNPTYTGAVGLEKEIYINNVTTAAVGGEGPSITGCAGATVSAAEVSGTSCTSSSYQTTQGVKASTTGNIYGIYDLSGGSWEHIMGAMYNSNNTTLALSSSGFSSATIDSANFAKYIDKYTYGTAPTDYNRGKLGDATGEVRDWNGDDDNFIYSSYSWFYRGGRYALGARDGAFNYSYNNGSASLRDSFRVTLIG